MKKKLYYIYYEDLDTKEKIDQVILAKNYDQALAYLSYKALSNSCNCEFGAEPYDSTNPTHIIAYDEDGVLEI